MKKIIGTVIIVFSCIGLMAQFTVRLVVNSVATKKQDDIFVTGSFNKWNPGDINYKLKPFGPTRKAIVLKDIPAGKLEFKFTRGSYDKVETTASGNDIENRSADVQADISIDITIPGWRDDYPDKPKPNTATAQVQLLDSAFLIPQLNRTRRIWVYLPKSYNQTKGKYYPVLYMQDGQNLFSEKTAAFGEWGVDECLDSLQQKTGKEYIVVGIDHGGDKRLTEYNPYDTDKYGTGEGKQYVDFLLNTLKPFIDNKFRTIKDYAHTAIAGSSMGALISLYAIIQYPKTFGAAGIFSPSLWIAPQIYEDAQAAKWTNLPRFYLYAGSKEGETTVPDIKRMYELIAAKNNYDIQEIVYPLGQHNEAYWRKEFANFYQWLVK